MYSTAESIYTDSTAVYRLRVAGIPVVNNIALSLVWAVVLVQIVSKIFLNLNLNSAGLGSVPSVCLVPA